MGGFLSFKIAPGVRISASSRGLRGHVGPRMARIHVGGGRTGVSTGVGPVTAYQPVGVAARRPRGSRPTHGLTPAQADKLRQVEEAHAEFVRIECLHRAEFSGPGRQTAPSATLPRFGKLLATAEKQSSAGIRWTDRPARKAARATARITAERWASDLLVLAENERRAQQEGIDARWTALTTNDPHAVISTLVDVFAGRDQVRVAGMYGDDVGLVVTVPSPEVVPDRKPATTPTGSPTLHQVTKTERNEWYAQVVAAHVLLAAKEMFAHAPGVEDARVMAMDDAGTPILGARVVRDLLASTDWRRGAWAILWDVAPGIRQEVRGRTHELVALDLGRDEIFGPLLTRAT